MGRSICWVAFSVVCCLLVAVGCRRSAPAAARVGVPVRTMPPEPWADIEPPFVLGDTTSSCPSIEAKDCPALVYVEGREDDECLCVAHFGAEGLHRVEILSANGIEVYPLDDAVLLVRTSVAKFADDVYVADLRKGVVKYLGQRLRLHLLRTAPDRKKAMLISYAAGFEKIALVELDLATLNLRAHSRVTERLLTDSRPAVGFDMRLSPDFKRIAFASLRDEPGVRRETRYALMVLDLSTMKVSEVDPNVRVEISGVSSVGMGRPPLEWVSDREIIYQHVIPARAERAGMRLNATHVLKVANVQTGEVAEWARVTLRLSMDGGSLRANPFNGEIVYRGEWVVDVEAGALRPKDEGLRVGRLGEARPTTVIHGERGVGDWPLGRGRTLVSASRKHYAYRLAPSGSKSVAIYARLAGLETPIRVAERSDSRTRPVAWIEDTRPLR